MIGSILRLISPLAPSSNSSNLVAFEASIVDQVATLIRALERFNIGTCVERSSVSTDQVSFVLFIEATDRPVCFGCARLIVRGQKSSSRDVDIMRISYSACAPNTVVVQRFESNDFYQRYPCLGLIYFLSEILLC